VAALRQLAGECVSLKDLLARRVAELQSWRYESRQGQEQLRSEILLLERALDRCGRVLTELAKLGLDERLVRITEEQARMFGAFIRAVIESPEAGLTVQQQAAALSVAGDRLRLLSESGADWRGQW
jgi:hypothetical protein